MARRNRKNQNQRQRRDALTRIAKPQGLPLSRLATPLVMIEDRRSYHPDGYVRPLRTLSTSRHRLTSRTVVHATRSTAKRNLPNLFSLKNDRIAFQAPDKLLVCIRRKRRKEVIHATGQAGSRRAQKTPRYNQWSSIVC